MAGAQAEQKIEVFKKKIVKPKKMLRAVQYQLGASSPRRGNYEAGIQSP